MNVKFVASTVPSEELQAQGIKTAEDLLVFCARVSNPSNQTNVGTGEKLLRYCIRKAHWSVFEQADMTVEVTTSRAISAQILRHSSIKAQEFSQRYAAVAKFEPVSPRRQDTTNRQNSIDDLDQETHLWWAENQARVEGEAAWTYEEALSRGIAKESARFLLPMNAATHLYLKANVRDWIHYLKVRTGEETQLEHRQVAEAIKAIFTGQFPTVSKAVWAEGV